MLGNLQNIVFIRLMQKKLLLIAHSSIKKANSVPSSPASSHTS